jgi:hypothetical protein
MHQPARPERQDEEVQDRTPQPAAEFDHAPVVQELAQEGADGAGAWRRRRTEIHQQHAGARCAGRAHVSAA